MVKTPSVLQRLNSVVQQGAVKKAASAPEDQTQATQSQNVDPTQLPTGAAANVTEIAATNGNDVPGIKSLTVDATKAEGDGQQLGAVAINGTPANQEVTEILASPETVVKTATALINDAAQILAVPDEAFGTGVPKAAAAPAVAPVTDKDVELYIVKKANEGDAAMIGLLQYVDDFANGRLPKKAAAGDEPPKAAEEPSPTAPAESAPVVAEPPVEPAAAPAEGGAPAEVQAAGADIEAQAAELIQAVAQEIVANNPEIPEEAALQIADEAVGEILASAAGGEEPADVENIEQDPAQLIQAVAQEIVAQDPSIQPEEAMAQAEAAVSDAIQVANEQQAIGTVDENGAPVVPDEAAQASVDEMLKTAAANPLRGHLVPTINQLYGLDASGFAARVKSFVDLGGVK